MQPDYQSQSMHTVADYPASHTRKISRRFSWTEWNARTDAHDVPIPLMQRLDILVLKPGYRNETHPELCNLASYRPRVSRERVHGGEAVGDHRGNQRGEVRRGVDEDSVDERPSWRGREKREQDGREEEERGVHADVVGFVLAEDLVRDLCTRVNTFVVGCGPREKGIRGERTKPSATAIPRACEGEVLLLLPPVIVGPILRDEKRGRTYWARRVGCFRRLLRSC